MPSAVNQDGFGNQQGPWGNAQWNQGPAWGNQASSGFPIWHPAGVGLPAAVVFTVLGFMLWWPVGLAMMFYTIGTRRLRRLGRRNRAGVYQTQNLSEDGSPVWEAPWANWKAWTGGNDRPRSSSGNHAFDDYKNETLQRLEQEQQEFGAFLKRLRFARDKAEFDAFMAERRTPPVDSPPA